mmetsp:Transcript_14268/g.17989  ORF Transcript_14268/g.17989 Transcript_14268/m.17989 type:complete len:396 (+) Transcript_14268:144-1331(+)
MALYTPASRLQLRLFLFPSFLLLLMVLISKTLHHRLIILILLLLRISLSHNLHNILIHQFMIQPTTLRRMLGTLSPNQREIKISQHLRANVGAKTLHRRPLPNFRQNDRLGQIWTLTLPFGVYARHAQVFPHFSFQTIVFVRFPDVIPAIDAPDDGVRHARQLINLLDGNRIDLVIKVQTRHVLPIPHDNVHQLIHTNILPCEQIRTDNLILPHNLHRQLLRIGPELRQRHRGRKLHPPTRLLPKRHIRRTLIHPNTHRLQLLLQYLTMPIQSLLTSIKHDQNRVAAPRARNHFLSATFPVRRTFDNTRQIEDLDFTALVLHRSGYARQGGEFVRRRFGLGGGEGSEEGGFSDRGEADEGYAGVAEAFDVEAFPAASRGGVFDEEFVAEFGEFGF